MSKFIRSVFALFAVAVAATGLQAGTAEAQETIPASTAQAFLGTWTIALDAQGQAFALDLNVLDAEQNVAAEVTSEMMPGATKAHRVAKNGDNLVLSFNIDAQGQTVPMVMTLTPDGAGLNASVDFAAGMFVAAGKGTKK